MEPFENGIDPEIEQAICSSFGKDDSSVLLKFLHESHSEITDVYRGICAKTFDESSNIWGGCSDENSCVSQRERKIEEENRLDLSQKRKRRKSNIRRRKPEICKCNFNPVRQVLFLTL